MCGGERSAVPNAELLQAECKAQWSHPLLLCPTQDVPKQSAITGAVHTGAGLHLLWGREFNFGASKAPALSRTLVIFLLAAQLSDCCLHISCRLSTDDITGRKGVWNNLSVWEPHAYSRALRIQPLASKSLSASQLGLAAAALTQPTPRQHHQAIFFQNILFFPTLRKNIVRNRLCWWSLAEKLRYERGLDWPEVCFGQ